MLRTGAMAMTAAGASTAAHAATVQITFNNSGVSSAAWSTAVLDTDFGDDNVNDLRGAADVGAALVYAVSPDRLIARATSSGGPHAVVLGWPAAYGPTAVVAGLTSFTLNDASVRGGAPTAGWLDMTATSRWGDGEKQVDVHRFIFDDASGVAPAGVSHADAAYPEYGAAVPEPSGLGLLALGAGGLLARRRRAMAA